MMTPPTTSQSGVESIMLPVREEKNRSGAGKQGGSGPGRALEGHDAEARGKYLP